MIKANVLSRRENHAIEIKDDNKGIIVISLEMIRSSTILITNEGAAIRHNLFLEVCKLSEKEVCDLDHKYKIKEERDGCLTNE